MAADCLRPPYRESAGEADDGSGPRDGECSVVQPGGQGGGRQRAHVVLLRGSIQVGAGLAGLVDGCVLAYVGRMLVCSGGDVPGQTAQPHCDVEGPRL